ncbi:MAG TPA: cytochrome c3 family protein [Myxococcaceae bacterium]|nr:cytochrome c3 family protein [Myxococcaceae bacterium]
MKALLPLVLLLSQTAPAPAPDDGRLPASVEALFQEKNKDGTPVLGDAERAYLKKLPLHTRELVGKDVDALTIGGARHLKALLSLELPSQGAAIVFSDNCVLCHADPESQKKAQLFSPDPKATQSNELLNLKEFVNDVHFRRGLSCSGCHGGSPEHDVMTADIAARWPKAEVRHVDRTWIPEFCARCHADPNFMRGFNPSLPTDQLSKYRDSQHGILLLQKKDSKAAQCVSCHGVHGIRSPKSRLSKVHPQAIPETCGKCHADPAYMAGYKKDDGTPLPTNQLADYKKSVHGKALLERGDLGAPACNSCHGNHAAMPPKVSSISQVCRTCHSQNGIFFDGSKHKQAFEKHGWPECERCHGKHDIEKPSDILISAAPDGLCGSCHDQNAKDNPECNATARYFRSSLLDLAATNQRLRPEAEELATRGLDAEPILASLDELHDALVQTRSRVHTFDRGGFDQGAKVGREAVAKTERLIDSARKEQRYRRNGLLVSIGLMSFLAVMMGLKIRQIGRGRREP